MEHKITRIQYADSLRDRTDGRYPMRIGRTVIASPQNLCIGYPAYLRYVKDSDGSDYCGILRTSPIREIYWDELDYSKFRIETMNSIFTLEKVEDDEQ